jgi:hypothetical protein
MSDYELRRSIADIQSKLGSLDYRVMKMAAGSSDAALPGAAMVRHVSALVARTVVGMPNLVAAPLRSLFQSDTTGMRAVLDTGWTARAGAVATMTGVTW